MERIEKKKKKYFNLKGDDVVLLLLRGNLFLIRNGHSYPLETTKSFDQVARRLKLAEMRKEEFPDVFWELRDAS